MVINKGCIALVIIATIVASGCVTYTREIKTESGIEDKIHIVAWGGVKVDKTIIESTVEIKTDGTLVHKGGAGTDGIDTPDTLGDAIGQLIDKFQPVK